MTDTLIAAHWWPANPRHYPVSIAYSGNHTVHLTCDDLDEAIELVYALMDAIAEKGTGECDAEWGALLNLLGHMQRHTIGEYWPELAAGVPATEPAMAGTG